METPKSPMARSRAVPGAKTAPALAQEGPARHPGFRSGAWVWLLRHGEVHADHQGRAYGGMDVPLSDDGLRDTRRGIEAFGALAIRHVQSSTLVRARLLGEGIAAAAGAKLEVSDGLAEIQRGRWQGRRIADLSKEAPQELAGFYADPWNYREHGGETDRDVLERAWPRLERAVRSGADLVALTCHYNVVRVLISRALGIPPPASFRLRVDLSSACLLHDGPDGWRLVRANVKSPQPWPPRV